ncbi:unnamed protein product, partial [Prorocentrum cordatum]
RMNLSRSGDLTFAQAHAAVETILGSGVPQTEVAGWLEEASGLRKLEVGDRIPSVVFRTGNSSSSTTYRRWTCLPVFQTFHCIEFCTCFRLAASASLPGSFASQPLGISPATARSVASWACAYVPSIRTLGHSGVGVPQYLCRPPQGAKRTGRCNPQRPGLWQPCQIFSAVRSKSLGAWRAAGLTRAP